MLSCHPWGTGYLCAACEGYGFQTVKSKIGYRMKSESLAHFPENWSIAWRFKSTLRKPGFPFKKMKLANLSILQ